MLTPVVKKKTEGMPRQFETPMESALKDLFNYLLSVIRRVSFSSRILSHVSLSKQLLPLRIAERSFRVMQVVLNLFIKPAHVDALPEFRDRIRSPCDDVYHGCGERLSIALHKRMERGHIHICAHTEVRVIDGTIKFETIPPGPGLHIDITHGSPLIQ